MKNGPEISVIIPTFNAEPYIERCIKSIVESKADKSMYEIIAVDDSSTDKTLERLKEIAKSTPHMKVYFRHKSGPGGARNLGMNYAKGRYVMFVDIDDHVDSKNFSHLVNILLPLYDQDIVGIDYAKTDESGVISQYCNKLFPYCREMSGAEYMNSQTPESVLWGYLYRRKFLIDNELKFIEKNIYDHEEFVTRAFCLAQKIVFLPTQIYYFHHDIKESLSNKPGNTHQEKLVSHHLTIIEVLQKFCFMLGDPMSEAGLERKLDFSAATIVKRVILRNYEEEFIKGAINNLQNIGLYPLRKEAGYGLRYRVLRRSTNSTGKIFWWRQHNSSPLVKPVAKYIFG